MAGAAHADELREAFETHLAETRAHVERLERLFSDLRLPMPSQQCKAMQGLIAEGGEIVAASGDPAAKDAALIGAAQRIGTVNSHVLVEKYLARIKAYDQDGPRLNAMIALNPKALEEADALDAERRAGRVRGPLHGIPIVLKDNIDTADRMQTTAGTLALVGVAVTEDAPVARRLRDAGAVLLAKANMSEWANFRSDHSTSGWSARGGQCRNPYARELTPCGSPS